MTERGLEQFNPRSVVHVIYSGLGGHAAVMFTLLAGRFFSGARHRVILAGVEPPASAYVTKLDADGIPWCYVGKRPAADHFAFYRSLRREIGTPRPDLVFLNGLAAVPAVIGMVGPRILLRESQAGEMKSWGEWAVQGLAHIVVDHVVHLTAEAEATAKKRLGACHRDRKVAVIPNGLDTGFFAPEERPTVSGLTLGMASRLQENKDHATLLEALVKLRTRRSDLAVKLHIAGDGATRSDIEADIARLGLLDAVTMHGMLDAEELREMLRGLDIYVHATHGETMSNSIMQAMACGLPVVASDVAGVSNMVGDRHGLLYAPGDADALATAIEHFADDRAHARASGAIAREIAVSEFDMARTAARYEALVRGQA